MTTYNHLDRDVQEESKSQSLDYVLIKRLLTYLAPYRVWVIAALVILVISKAIEAWVPIQIGQIAQTIVADQSDGAAERQQAFSALLQACFIVLGWILFNYILDVSNILIKNWVGQKAILTMRAQIYSHIQRLSMSFYDKSAIGRLMTRTIHDVDQINQLLSESLIPLIGSLILFFGIFIGTFILNWRVGLLFCVIFPLIWWLVHYFRHNQRRSYNTLRSILSALNAFVQEHLMGVHIIRRFGLYASEKKKFDRLNRDYLQVNLDTIHYFAFFFSGIELLQNFTMIGVFALLIYFNPTDFGLEVGTFVTISVYSLMIFRPLIDLAERYNILQSAMAASERIFAILNEPLEPSGPQPGLPLEKIETIEFHNVWFAYEKENWILKGLTFKIGKGESVALVGVTGSGKTSVINILLRFYDFQKGQILINGHDIHDYSVMTLRKQFSVILQDPFIFSGSIRDNIALFDPNMPLEQVRRSADFVNLTPIVDRFPDGFEHHLAERGSSLSVGEMQLIALARAVAHHGNMLVLDEATSNIDVHTESVIQAAIKKILENKTALVIAHRLSTIKDVTRIIVLSQGRVAESGTHQQLLEAQGMYEKLYHLQYQGG